MTLNPTTVDECNSIDTLDELAQIGRDVVAARARLERCTANVELAAQQSALADELLIEARKARSVAQAELGRLIDPTGWTL